MVVYSQGGHGNGCPFPMCVWQWLSFPKVGVAMVVLSILNVGMAMVVLSGRRGNSCPFRCVWQWLSFPKVGMAMVVP